MRDTSSIIFILIVGLIAGALANVVIPTTIGIVGAIVVGVVGAFIGSALFPALGFKVSGNPTIAAIITATAGAIILLIVLRLITG